MPPLELPVRETTVHWYLGVNDNLARGSVEGSDDLGVPIELVARTNEYLAQGIGGEAIWTNIYLALFRSNDDDLELSVVPIVDGTAEDAVQVILAAVAEPTRQTLELGLARYHPSAADPRTSSAMRGTTFALEIRSVGVIPAGRLRIEGIELEWEPALESKEAANASS